MKLRVWLVVWVTLAASEAFAADFTGFWKEDCSDAFGVQIKPQSGNVFSVSFCGPGGCSAPGTWMPNTTIEGDPRYRVLGPSTLEIQHGDRWQRLTKCTTDTNPILDYSTMKNRQPRGGGIVVFEPNRGLPAHERNSPFTTTDSRVHENLRRGLASTAAAAKECKVSDVTVPDFGKTPLFSNICNRRQYEALRTLVTELAPNLSRTRTTVWKSDLTGDAQPDILVGYIDISTDEHFRYPYLSVWRLEFKQGRYEAQFGGSFLTGQIHAIRPFGHDNTSNKVFVRHYSCVECEPWVYLTIVDFSQTSAKSFEFTYSPDHRDYGSTIEYGLPGIGHSVDASVETRIPRASMPNRPDLIQTFRFRDENKIEWWVFSCTRGRCNYELYESTLPSKYRTLWASADRL